MLYTFQNDIAKMTLSNHEYISVHVQHPLSRGFSRPEDAPVY